MKRKIFIFFIVIIILSIILCYVSLNLKKEANLLYKSTHKEKLTLEDHGIYSEVIPYTEVSEGWDENKYIQLCNINEFIDNTCPFMIFLSLYSIILTEVIYELEKEC